MGIDVEGFTVGDEGAWVGLKLGRLVGGRKGRTVGESVYSIVGTTVGIEEEGFTVGDEGCAVGDLLVVGTFDGFLMEQSSVR